MRVDTPEPQGPTELVTIAQLENRLADSVRSAWLGVPSLFPDWFCSQELLVSICDSLRRGCPLLDLDSKLTGMLADRDTLNAYLTTEITPELGICSGYFRSSIQLDFAMSSGSSQEISSG